MSLFRSIILTDKTQIKGLIHNDGTVTNVVKVTIADGREGFGRVYREKRLTRGAEYARAVALLKRGLPV